MAYVDKTLECVDCGTSFTFGAGEQEFFGTKGFINEPRRCPDCRAARKQQRGGSSGGGNSYGYQRQREMYPAVCASCGKDTQVPFEPRNGRPVYCSDCYATVRR
ncbi:MAG: zinc-ribbon domain containing protein [Dehalococcoidia bacterium]|nr:zinc-ribbon domain containing protein [Dehalococcoidia bacterium]